jgi:hypothetical protein
VEPAKPLSDTEQEALAIGERGGENGPPELCRSTAIRSPKGFSRCAVAAACVSVQNLPLYGYHIRQLVESTRAASIECGSASLRLPSAAHSAHATLTPSSHWSPTLPHVIELCLWDMANQWILSNELRGLSHAEIILTWRPGTEGLCEADWRT